MIEWLKNLELEFIILFGLVGIIVLLTIVLLIKAQRTLNLIGKRALILTEDLLKRDGEDVVDISIANSSYVNVEASAIGIIYKKTLLPLKEENVIILARDSYKLTLPLNELRTFVLASDTKVKNIKVYAEDSLGRRTKRKAKNSMSILKKILRSEKKSARIVEKKNRFETGNYRFFERVGLVFAVLFSPFTNLFKSIKRGLNRKLKLRENKLELKKKEAEHQAMLREVADEERREEDRAKLEKRILEEQKTAHLEARKAALKRKEEARILQKQVKESEEELRLAEAEALLHESENKEYHSKNVDESITSDGDELGDIEVKNEEIGEMNTPKIEVNKPANKKKKTATKPKNDSKSEDVINNEEVKN